MNMTVRANTLSVTCFGWTANDQTCTCEVRTLSQDCGFISDVVTSDVTLSSEYCIGGNNYTVLVKYLGLLIVGNRSRCMMYILYAMVI